MPTPGKRPSMRQIFYPSPRSPTSSTAAAVFRRQTRGSRPKGIRLRHEHGGEEPPYGPVPDHRHDRAGHPSTTSFQDRPACGARAGNRGLPVFVCNSAKTPPCDATTSARWQASRPTVICISGLQARRVRPPRNPLWSASTVRPKTTSVSHTGSDNIGGGYMSTEHLHRSAAARTS